MNNAKNNFIVAHVAATVTRFQEKELGIPKDTSTGNPVKDCIINAKHVADTMEAEGLKFIDPPKPESKERV